MSEVIAQSNKLVGDEEVNAELHKVEVEVNDEGVAAQVSPPREADAATVPVSETSVRLDEVITDPSDPRAVQVPDAGRGFLDLPIHGLSAPTPEEVFADSPAEPEDEDE